jgi:hypothetical protein
MLSVVYAECRFIIAQMNVVMLSVICFIVILSVIMMNVVMFYVVMLRVVAPSEYPHRSILRPL